MYLMSVMWHSFDVLIYLDSLHFQRFDLLYLLQQLISTIILHFLIFFYHLPLLLLLLLFLSLLLSLLLLLRLLFYFVFLLFIYLFIYLFIHLFIYIFWPERSPFGRFFNPGMLQVYRVSQPSNLHLQPSTQPLCGC